jgi:hypothetical protein
MPGVAATIDLKINAKQTGSGDLGTPQILVAIEKALEFTPGTASVSQSNVLFSDKRTLAASASEDIDVAGALTDALGASIAAAEIVAVYVGAASANTNDVQVTRPGANGVPLFLAAGDGLALGPGDFALLTNRKGAAVTAGTGDLIHVANSGAGSSVTYDIVILGRTVAA